MQRRARTAVLLLGVGLGAVGCFRIGVTVGSEIPSRQVERIVPGVTTKDEVLRWFGAPAEASDGAIFARLVDVGEMSPEDLAALPFADLLVFQITDGVGRALVTLLYNQIDVHLKRDRLVVFFDENDVVLYYGITRQRGAEEAEDAEPEEASESVPARPRRRGGELPR